MLRSFVLDHLGPTRARSRANIARGIKPSLRTSSGTGFGGGAPVDSGLLPSLTGSRLPTVCAGQGHSVTPDEERLDSLLLSRPHGSSRLDSRDCDARLPPASDCSDPRADSPWPARQMSLLRSVW